ncbi:MAG: ferritin-like domain-containing protein [Xenococcaceae cyanobacterium MO_188.B32]|nr:ferritin-like domain-containing protein [Xenococcaceae cyanobacterium MO_188.B32]
MEIGSEAHKQLFCYSFLNSHRLYEPENLPWPILDSTTRQMLQNIPFWDEALYTERRAGDMLAAFAATVEDSLLHEAIALQGREESRHARLIEFLIKHYDLEVPSRPKHTIPKEIEPAFVNFGYGECFDSFFAFGLFGIVRQASLMPDDFFTIFDPVLDEEARHMVFFVNWMAYKLAVEGKNHFRAANSLWQYSKALQRRLGNFKSSGKKQPSNNQKGFTATGAKSLKLNLTLEGFLETCLQENAKRMRVYDDRLLKPEFIPSITSITLKSIGLLPKRKSSPVVEST